MKFHLLAFLFLSLSLTTAGRASGEITKYGSFKYVEDLPKVLFLFGEITPGSSFDLRRAMRDHPISILVTASPGGNLYEGLRIATTVHDNEMHTYLPEAASCESACALVFLGGKNRVVFGELGVHQFYTGGKSATEAQRQDVTTSVTQYTTSEIIGILNEFDTPPFVYEKMFGTGEIYYFRGGEKQRLSRDADDQLFFKQMSSIDSFLERSPDILKRAKPQEVEPSSPSRSSQPKSVDGFTPDRATLEKLSDTDFFGMDLLPNGIRDISIQTCEIACKRNKACAAYSYVTATRWCWLKAGIENFSFASGVISAVVDQEKINPEIFDRPFLETTGHDIPGYDIYPRGLKNMSLDQCRHACQALSGCRAFSYVPKRRWCFPKYGSGKFEPRLGIVSGVLQN
jgi:hypothetical protein